MGLKEKLQRKLASMAQKSVNSYLEYQVMMKQPTVTEPFNDLYTRLKPGTRSEDETQGITCCCDKAVTKGENLDADGDTICPGCTRAVLFSEVLVK